MGMIRPLPFLAALSRSSMTLADPPGRIEHHVPGQVGDLARAQARLGRQQHDHAIAQRVSGAAGKDQQIVEIGRGQKFCLFAWHYDSNCYEQAKTISKQ